MPRSKKDESGQPKRRNKSGKGELPQSAVIYSGPIRTLMDKSEAEVNTVVLVQDAAATSTAGGVLAPTFTFLNPGSCTDWASCQSVWDEYKVLGMEVVFTPNLTGTLNTTGLGQAYAPIYVVIDRDSNTALTGYAQAANYSSMETHTLDTKFKTVYKMHGSNLALSTSNTIVGGEGQFLNCSANALITSGGCVKWFAGGLTASTTYGRFTVYYRIQFRGKGV